MVMKSFVSATTAGGSMPEQDSIVYSTDSDEHAENINHTVAQQLIDDWDYYDDIYDYYDY